MERLRDRRGRLEREVEEVVTQVFGREFILQSIDFRRGSVEILVTIGAIYTVVAQYHDMVESVELFIQQLRRIFGRQMSSEIRLTASVQFSKGWPSASGGWLLAQASPAGSPFLVFYLVLINTLLTSVLVYLVLSR